MREVIVGVFLGAFLTALVAWVGWRYRRIATSKVLAEVMWEELSALAFVGASAAGFTSRVFDTQFHTVFWLPASLRRDLLRYYWRMKYLDGQWKLLPPPGLVSEREAAERLDRIKLLQEWLDEMEVLRDRLLERLRWYADRFTIRLFVFNAEDRLPWTSLLPPLPSSGDPTLVPNRELGG
jgi:hypothetical protein